MARTPKGPNVRIVVTDEVITQSLARDSRHCMIAEALKVSRPDARNISVDLSTIRFTDQGRGLRFTYLTPRIAQVQLVNFDQGRKPEPFSFLLRGAHVTRSGNTKPPKHMTDEQRAQRREAGLKLNQRLKKTKLVNRHKSAGVVPDRIGGKTPPLQTTSVDALPFSRRRAFGLRGLEY